VSPAPAVGATPETVDVCLVVEGCYPFITGGVASWVDWLIRQQPQLRFAVVAVIADGAPRSLRYELPDNVASFQMLVLNPPLRQPRWLREPSLCVETFSRLMCAVLGKGDVAAFRRLVGLLAAPQPKQPWLRFGDAPGPVTYDQLMSTRFAWDVLVTSYRRLAPQSAFADFFWAWRALVGGLFAMLTAPLPSARAYHTISTGYAGLVAAAASARSGRPAAITEHGIYTNERRIDLLMAEWIKDAIQPSLATPDAGTDVRDFWIETFEAYARICYGICARITTLYGENQAFQRTLGALEARLEVIPNGIHVERFAAIERTVDRPPTIALIGRVVPIKDIVTFICAVARLKAAVPMVRALILGPTDEDPDYFVQCERLVAELDLNDTVTFTGKVNIIDHLPQIDVVVLTSISEAQPLVLLEAGAAGIPCVATDVGSCREIIEGLPDETPTLGRGGRIVPPMATAELADAIAELLRDEPTRAAAGEVLRTRVRQSFTSERSAARYADLYRGLIAA